MVNRLKSESFEYTLGMPDSDNIEESVHQSQGKSSSMQKINLIRPQKVLPIGSDEEGDVDSDTQTVRKECVPSPPNCNLIYQKPLKRTVSERILNILQEVEASPNLDPQDFSLPECSLEALSGYSFI